MREPSRNFLNHLRKPAHACYLLLMSERKTLGRAIRVIRKEKKITQDELAVAGDMSPSHLQRIETGERQPLERNLKLICKHLGIEVEDITYEVETLILVADPAHANLVRNHHRRVLVSA